MTEPHKKTFRERYSLEVRKQFAQKILTEHPQRFPVIVEKDAESDAPPIEKEKFLVPQDITVGKFIYEIRSKMKNLGAEKSIFIYVNESLPPSAALMLNVYSKHKDPDGFLYVKYSGENTFGHI
eukprot:TRINITY_DN4895_c0_g1_i1.p1 TRINITY_DN4895_c0_g1~~TRINITY_DN4895_c0_g1_i1.p1  ORF type:complete len:124 (+),score=21.79 TRINITY_DN4895_c0_g1_i1:55-426(+)